MLVAARRRKGPVAVALEENDPAIEETHREIDVAVVVEVGRGDGEEAALGDFRRQIIIRDRAERAVHIPQPHAERASVDPVPSEIGDHDVGNLIAVHVRGGLVGGEIADAVKRGRPQHAAGAREADAEFARATMELDDVVPPVLVEVLHGHSDHFAVHGIHLIKHAEAGLPWRCDEHAHVCRVAVHDREIG